jgi:hypothetical protein
MPDGLSLGNSGVEIDAEGAAFHHQIQPRVHRGAQPERVVPFCTTEGETCRVVVSTA